MWLISMRNVTIACPQKPPNLDKHIVRLDWPDNTWQCWCKNCHNNSYGRVSAVYSSSWSHLNRREASPVYHFQRNAGSQNICMHVRSARFSSTREVQTLSGYFGYCEISLNTEKIIIPSIFFWKSWFLTRLCCNLAICDKITRFVAFFLIDDFFRLPFQSLKSNKI